MTIDARTPKSSHLVLLAAMGLHCSSSQTAVTVDERVGSAQIALTLTPPNARCMNLVVTGTRTVNANFDLTPGPGSIVNVDGLPVGFDTFSGLVYPVGCGAVNASTTASWKVVPTVANIQPDFVNAVNLTLQTNAVATVCLNFEGQDAAGDACASDASFVDAGADRDADVADAPRDGDAAVTCSAGQVLCGGMCINPQTSQQFCGATAGCGVDGGSAGFVCNPAQACVSGACISCTTFPIAQQVPNAPGAAGPFDLVVTDLNADGRRDIATANNMSDDISVFINSGTGTFGLATRFGAGATPSGIAALDLNGDLRPDLAVSNNGPSTLSYLASTAAPGQFAPPLTFSTATAPAGLATGDFNRDGRPDVVVATNSGVIAMHFGAAGGGFAPGPAAMVGGAPRTITVADVNADMNLDFFVANQGTGSVNVLLGTPVGGFMPVAPIMLGPPVQQVAIGDFNTDGRPDLAIATQADVRVFFGSPMAGVFTPGPVVPPMGSTPTSIATVDVDGDARLDLVIANVGSSNVNVLLGNGAGGFVPLTTLNLGAQPRMLAVADLNGDNKPDIVTANLMNNNVSVALAVKPAGCP